MIKLSFPYETDWGCREHRRHLLYTSHSHKDLNHNSNTIHIQIQADSVDSDMNGFINFLLRSMATRGEIHNSYYADPNPTGGASCDI